MLARRRPMLRVPPARVDHVIRVPRTHDALTPILASVPLQLLAYHIAVLRGCNVEQLPARLRRRPRFRAVKGWASLDAPGGDR